MYIVLCPANGQNYAYGPFNSRYEAAAWAEANLAITGFTYDILLLMKT